LIDHGGGIEGFNTFLAYDPEDKLTVVARQPQRAALEAIASKLAAGAHDEDVVLPSERRKSLSHLPPWQSMAAPNELTPDFDSAMTLDGDNLENCFLMTTAGRGAHRARRV